MRSLGASDASQTIVSTPLFNEWGAPVPPISVLTQPGSTEFTAIFLISYSDLKISAGFFLVELYA